MITFSNDHFFDFEKQARPIKSIALIHKNMKPGGVEMLVVRMVKWLSARGYNVTLFLFSSGGPLLRQLETVKGVTIIVDEDTTDPSVNMWLVTKMLRTRFEDKFDLVYSFGPKSFLLSYLLPASKRLSGVYHPESYKQERTEKVIKTLKLIDPKFHTRLLFMNPSIQKMTEKAIGEPLNNSIFPMPLDFCSNSETQGNFESRRIVSIGRLAHFRTYNYYMIDIMEELIQLDPKFTYHIYGSGQDEDDLREKIANSPARDHIVMHGDFATIGDKKRALQDTFCFVGMGVPLIEAAGCGIPGITAKINDPFGLTEGFLHQLPPYESGDSFSADSELFSVQTQIEKLLSSETEYRKMSKRDRIKAREFESDHVMENFIKEAEIKDFSFRLH
ncbi:glycosyltransferase involved in cell wall biosynthesis [Planomicrobium stackebrandtii]|uniref:Glycosyltransferase involved in cell wall biosynthesis n=1 Tax=Planomicrobium stackebrandtii TaxID=253160 RepID=A0ABU0GTI4_9BACL|nr:glycosyltransferase [Planomicrobium stackebrandtii]MDQ0428378.1 glycosyltransferase involved in cell wall biosynthesis [Planomicrobium stackebrandtii]